MSKHKLTSKALDEIFEKIIGTVGDSKNEVYRLSEDARQEYQQIKEELEVLKGKVLETIEQGDKLETQARLARKRLSDVSRHFQIYSEPEVKDAYEKAHELQTKLLMNQQSEYQLRNRRDELERRLLTLEETIKRADHLVGQISVVLNYLTSDLKQVGEIVEDAIQKEYFGFRIIEAQEEERKRLSREIHDGPAQMLANVMMRSELIDRIYRERSAKEAMEEIRDLRKMVRSALYEVRRIIYDLRPMALDDLGLIPTLRKYLDTIEDYNEGKPRITFISIGQEKRTASKLEVALFRLVQEAVTNALKHADATEIQVKIEFNNEHAILLVKDDGCGFNQEEKKENSFGLIGMKERVDLLDGTISVHSKINQGTLVMIKVPIIAA
ncbi:MULTISPECIES: sensor histidine kinase [Priestia]|jgi:two-component system sensor histidine kinase DegS|uniref:Signal transduction histidine-protein kinase/phosphatase DegS n=4 Tax=Priestia TaxID=2800373 RepID=D5DWD5_PRIM1|nr:MULTISPECIES: sensor histidine kinase [Priestia]AVX10959.1 histidine kinase [Bacillus sp. Y-01]KOP77021.1 histidine kinase [Bacillus sp. FJAT-21351]KQU18180.1 histidine kinase [Bacillus sp. Leaf75]KRD82930.1 histidine kinase [Bacillus sp. Root147]KRD95222.1 histidine kinase [Bacillus sp. Root239]KRF47508.1 histidine kinase [Bacillus sp. Soil531]MBK0009196.1 histidine kinase [Bacillus sp. S35]MBK0294819.1 histidine kinase [Bacillus sp. S34]MBU8854672.1 histidine kinase [Bacillus sp. FJAT